MYKCKVFHNSLDIWLYVERECLDSNLRQIDSKSSWIKNVLLLVFILSLGLVLKAQTKVDGKLQNPEEQTLLPDGTLFMRWSDHTHYLRTYHVSQNNPNASDKNDGTEGHPFLTINHAAQVVKAGERVYIHSGVYRELVRPLFSGESPEKMISYEAAPGEAVVIKGSRVIPTKWELSVDPNDSENAALQKESKEVLFSGQTYSRTLYMTAIPDSLFDNNYFPLRIPNTTLEEFKLMGWASRWIGRIPYTLPRCLLFQDGKRMVQLSSYEDIARVPGSCWVASDGKAIHIHPFEDCDPNSKTFEIAVQEHLIQPETTGLGFIRVSGLILEHCANSFLRTGVGALFTMGGHHWILEKNIVRHINSLGIEIGSSAYENRDPRNIRKSEATRQRDLNRGYHIVQQNIVYDCGTAGIRGLKIEHALVEGNEIFDCGWQDAEYHWEVAGIKLLENKGTLVKNNYIHNIIGADGIWLDYENQNSRVTGNVIHNLITSRHAGIFIEASSARNMVDNNILWNIKGQGVRLAETSNAIVTHNLFWNVLEEQVMAMVYMVGRSVGGVKCTSTGNRIVNNIIVDQGKPILYQDSSNITDYNVYVSTLIGHKAIKDSGRNSVAIQAEIKLDEEGLILSWNSISPLPMVPLIKNCELDFFNRERTLDHNLPGPFQALDNNLVKLKLFDGLVLKNIRQ